MCLKFACNDRIWRIFRIFHIDEIVSDKSGLAGVDTTKVWLFSNIFKSFTILKYIWKNDIIKYIPEIFGSHLLRLLHRSLLYYSEFEYSDFCPEDHALIFIPLKTDNLFPGARIRGCSEIQFPKWRSSA